jgi:hypothetical protein
MPSGSNSSARIASSQDAPVIRSMIAPIRMELLLA